MLDIYSPLRVADVPFVITNVESAELIKYASNGFLATKISFINEVAELCEALGADVEVVARGMGLDNRIGPRFLHPGPGFGGSCFPKDTRAVARIAREHGLAFRIIEAVLEVNDAARRRMVEKIDAAFAGVGGKTIALLGLSFKPETDDIRESPALTLIEQLRDAGARVAAYDPEAMDNVRAQLGDAIELATDPYAAMTDADALVLVTEWHELRALDYAKLSQRMRTPILFDGRNVWSPDEARRSGFVYYGIGRK
jgi:UDPglucose 6-dehydrogenase